MEQYDEEFMAWFKQNYAEKSFPWKDGMRPWNQLPASFRAQTFTLARLDWLKEKR